VSADEVIPSPGRGESQTPVHRALALLTLFLVCIAAASVAYYFGWHLPRAHDVEAVEERRKTDLESSQRCSADGLRFSADYLHKFAAEVPDPLRYSADPQMHFNSRLNTCLVELTWDRTWSGEFLRSSVVIDIYSNREVISTEYTFDHREPVPSQQRGAGGKDPKVYLAQKEKLFSE